MLTVADIPAASPAGGSSRLIVTGKATTLEPPDDEAAGATAVTRPFNVTPRPSTTTVTGWPTASEPTSRSATWAVTSKGPVSMTMASPLGASTPSLMETDVTIPSAGARVVAAAIWLLIFDPRGIANQLVNALAGTPGVDHKWLVEPGMLQLATMLVYVWKYVGYFTIIFIAGIGTIPRSLYEAARVDGASAWQVFSRITLPLLKPTTLLVSVVAMIQCLRTFSTQYLFTQAGSPRSPIDVITLNVYYTAVRSFQIGRASALSIILFAIMLLLSWLQFRVARSEEVSYL